MIDIERIQQKTVGRLAFVYGLPYDSNGSLGWKEGWISQWEYTRALEPKQPDCAVDLSRAPGLLAALTRD